VWIELHQAVWTHRKTFELASLLELDETYAAAHVIRLWTWALDNAPDGDLSALSDRAIAFGSGWRHDVGPFVDALIASGWVDAGRTLHDWDQYAGRLVKLRKDEAERKKAARLTGRPADVRRMSGATVPYRTLPDLTGPDPGTPPNPPVNGGVQPGRKRRRSSNGLMAPGVCGGCGAADHESKDCPTYGGVFRRVTAATTTEGA
jgi:hypothetical protein